MKLYAFSKINLFLEVGPKRPNGYHDIDSIMQSVTLADEVELSVDCEADFGIDLRTIGMGASDNGPIDTANLAYRAAELILKDSNISAFAKIELRKHIPIAAGLGGGSADAAATMLGLCESISLDADDYAKRSALLGADVPFCLFGGCAASSGIGEVLTRLPSRNFDVVVAIGKTKLSTAEQYRKLDAIRENKDFTRRPSSGMIEAIKYGSIRDVADELYNAFESIGETDEETKAKMMRFGALGSLMSGSGPSVFGIFDSPDSAEYAAKRLRDDGIFASCAKFSPCGVAIIEE